MNKRFSRKLYIQNDKKAKNAIMKLLKGTSFYAEENEKKLGVDLLLFKNEKHIGYIECENKKVWISKFKWNTVQIPQRKRKYAKIDRKKPTYFVIFNHNNTKHMVIKGKDLLASKLKEVPNKYVFKGEYFFQVPIKKTHKNLATVILKDYNKPKKRLKCLNVK